MVHAENADNKQIESYWDQKLDMLEYWEILIGFLLALTILKDVPSFNFNHFFFCSFWTGSPNDE